MGKLKYDKDLLDFVEDRHPLMYHILRVLKFLGYTLALVLLYYLIFTLFFSSEEEKNMLAESRLIEDEYDRLASQVDLLEKAVGELGVKDEDIYRELFNTGFPSLLLSADTSDVNYRYGGADNASIISGTNMRLKRLDREFRICGNLLSGLADTLSGYDRDMLRDIPAVLPIRNFPLGNIGASVGRKMHPFYKKVVYHGGLDFVVPAGIEVIATADGTVESVERAMKLQGTRIVIDHGNGYETVYAHLSDVLVRKGQKIKRGDIIARTGNSGTSFAPHLHYEVVKDGVQLDPLCFFSGELDVEKYGELLTYAVNTGQSLD